MANAEFGSVLHRVESMRQASFAAIAKLGLGAAEGDQRWLDRFDLHTDGIGNLH